MVGVPREMGGCLLLGVRASDNGYRHIRVQALMIKKKKKKPPGIGTLKIKAWKLTSLYIRRRAAVEGYAECVTCNKWLPWQEGDAGHWIPQARGNSVRYDTRNIHFQCKGCNGTQRGNLHHYGVFMATTYGPEVMQELQAKSRTVTRYRRQDYLDIIDEMAGRLARLVSEDAPPRIDIG